jgi:histidine ammonia-lyase
LQLKKFQLTGENVKVEDVWKVAYGKWDQVVLSYEAHEKLVASRRYIEKKIEAGEVIYGVNTGFGAFSSVRISDDEIEQLQKNLIRSHCCGVGKPFTVAETRAIMFLRANALARGHSGIRPVVVEKILEFLNLNIVPVIPSQGSVGASGDLAPLSHLALALIGEGEVWSDGEPLPAEKVLREKNVKPLVLKAKEGLSLINGCQVMTAVGLLAAMEARRLAWMCDLSGAMSLEGLKGTRRAFHPLISATRPHAGEAITARNMLKLLGTTSEIAESHAACGRVQDAYSLRCIPAVHGAAKDTIRYAIQVLETEANSSTDNPLVFADEGEILSCGNFHGEPVAFVLDFLAIAMSAMASISECRIEKLINPSMSDLPAFLAPRGGLNSGHMIVQVAAASLVSENKILSHPASVDSIPTSADKEDHVSMGTIAARKLSQIVKNAENIVAMEMLSASQALDLLQPLQPSAAVRAARDRIREDVPFAAQDRVFSKDIEKIKALIRADVLLDLIKNSVGGLEC